MKRKHTVRLTALLLALLLSLTPVSAEGLPFIDVSPSAWYYNAVCWAYETKAVGGTSSNTFSPDLPCTRAQLVTILWALAGKPTVEVENPFTDVSEDTWYYQAVLWAREEKITSGLTATLFGPDAQCTRAQALTFIWKYFGGPEVTPEVQYSDVPAGAWFYKAVNWAFSNGVTAGTGGDRFSPDTVVTRAMVVTFLYRMRHVLEGGEHVFTLSQELEADCTHGPGRVYTCSCGNKKTVYSGTGLGHDFCQATLVSDATATAATVYKLTCIRCGASDSKGNRVLGKPIYGQPLIQSKLKTHSWTADELKNGIRFNLIGGAKATITRRWFANSWCYITHVELPKGSYSSFTGTNVYNQYGSIDQKYWLTAYDEMSHVPEAQILINGDTQLAFNRPTLRAGKVYGNQPGWVVTYWNPRLGSYGRVSDLGADANSFDYLKNLGVTDTFVFRSPVVEHGRMLMTEFDLEADYSPSSYTTKGYRRQCTAIGFKKEGDTVHIYHVCADGCTYTNFDSTDPYNYANDRASYGNTPRELMILMSTLGVEHATNLDGGWSGALIIRRNGVIEQVNAADYSLKTGITAYPARLLWDFLYFK